MPLLQGVQPSSPAHHYYPGGAAQGTGSNAIAGPSGTSASSSMNLSPHHILLSPKRYQPQLEQQIVNSQAYDQQLSRGQQPHHDPALASSQQYDQQQTQYERQSQFPSASHPARTTNDHEATSSSKQSNTRGPLWSPPAQSWNRFDRPGQQGISSQAGDISNGASAHTHSSAMLTAPSTSGPVLTTAASLMREGPRDFTIIKAAGDGSFGTVSLADWKSPLPSGTMLSPMQHPTTRPEYVGKRLVAIKRMKKPFKTWNDCLKLKELKSLLDIPHHANIIPLYDAFLDPATKELHFVFECMEGNLYQLTKSRKGRPLAGGLVASIFKQIIHGLHHIHEHGYFHRDMKPENLLITTTGLDDYPAFQSDLRTTLPPERDVIVIVKLADFGLARETASLPPYTEYVSTRWYRAPEVLLRSKDYSNPVDLWALGTILAELVNLKPLFPGDSEVDQILQICDVLGDPFADYGYDSRNRRRGGGPWENGIKMAASVGFQWPKAPPIKFASLFSSRVPMELIDCIEDLLRYDPVVRFTTSHCLNHPYLLDVAPRLQPLKEGNKLPASNAHVPPAAVDPTAARQSLPPSHSSLPSNARPAFGEGSAPGQAQQVLSQQRIPFFRPQQQQSATSDSGSLAQRREEGHLRQSYDHAAISPGDSLHSHSHSQNPDAGGRFTSFSKEVDGAKPSMFSNNAGTAAADDPSVGSRPTERRKGWGMTFSSVFSGQNSNNSSGVGAHLSGHPHSLDPNAGVQARRPSYGGASTYDNTLAPIAGSSGLIGGLPMAAQLSQNSTGDVPAVSSQGGAPSDAKKAKKEAEKAARQAEKAKRLAQEKAARDRARAVMQKRNQIMAASDGKEQVEWLSNGLGGAADKGKGKQSISPASATNLSTLEIPRAGQQITGSGMLSLVSNGVNHGSQSNMSLLQQHRSPSSGYASHFSVNGPSNRQFHSPTGPYSHMLMGAMRGGARPGSVASYATNESDPGPYGGNRRLMAGHPGLKQRQTSASSLSSGLDTLAHSTGSHRFIVGSTDSFRVSTDVRSVHSLDSQLVSNMEAMTAAEGSDGVHYSSPPPSHPHVGVGLSNKTSRSRASSIQRGGSASPVHHTSAPRFHPYGGGSSSSGLSGPSPQSHHLPLSASSAQPSQPPGSSASRGSSSHSYYSQFPLPPILGEEDRRRGSRPTMIGGSSSTNAHRTASNSQDSAASSAERSVYHSHQVLSGIVNYNGGPEGYMSDPSQLNLDHGHSGSEGHGGSPYVGVTSGPAVSINPMWLGKGRPGQPAQLSGNIFSLSGGTGTQATRLPPFSTLIAAAPEEDSEMTDGSGVQDR